MAAPLLAAQERGEKGVALVVVPTKLLGEQLVSVMLSRPTEAWLTYDRQM